MEERLGLPPACEGALWHYRYGGERWYAHTHRELEVNLVLRGRAAYLVGDRRVALAANDLLFLFPAQEHHLLDLSPGFQLWNMVVAPERVARVAQGEAAVLAARDPPGLFHWRLPPPAARALAALWEGAAALRLPARINEALGLVLAAAWDATRDARRHGPGQALHPAVERAVRALQADPGARAPAVARAAGLSPGRLSRLFHQEMGITLVAYANQVRLERLAGLLALPQANLLEAALQAGFGSYSHCHRVVCRLTGRPPRALLPTRASV